ncbi:hypothetical protein [Nocardia sp. NPDC049707]|uniref:hypothetical protein n=1 Tax=Nocardia sp. NPDC049707 TaxID=3154735 RepID=UPI003443737C
MTDQTLHPIWKLDLAEEGVIFDEPTFSVRDNKSGESIGLLGMEWFLGRLTTSTTQTVLYDVRVRAAKPPTVGRWSKDAELG